MAMTTLAHVAPPKFLLVSEYTVRRVGLYPSAVVVYQECNFLLQPPLVLLSESPADATGHVMSFVVQDLGPTPNIAGHLLATLDSAGLDTIAATEPVVVTPATATAPAVMGTKITMTNGLDPLALTQPVAVVSKMPVGTNAYTPAPGGRRYEVTLSGANPSGMAELSHMLGTVYFSATKAALGQLGITTVTDAQIAGALQQLAAQGVSIDGFLAQQGEALEAKRQAGNLPYAMVMGL